MDFFRIQHFFSDTLRKQLLDMELLAEQRMVELLWQPYEAIVDRQMDVENSTILAFANLHRYPLLNQQWSQVEGLLVDWLTSAQGLEQRSLVANLSPRVA